MCDIVIRLEQMFHREIFRKICGCEVGVFIDAVRAEMFIDCIDLSETHKLDIEA